MNFFNRLIKTLQFVLPSPLSIAIILSFVTMLLAWILTIPTGSNQQHIFQILGFWEKGFWELLAFGMQMMLMLVLGHVLALTKFINNLINALTKHCTSTAKSAFIVSFSTILVSLLNWGLGLIFGAIIARKVGEKAMNSKLKINYPLIGAAGYVGLMVWHGGLSGSAPLKVAENNHFLADKIGVIEVSETLFSTMNISLSISLLILIPLLFYLIAKKIKFQEIPEVAGTFQQEKSNQTFSGAEKLDFSKWFIKLIAITILFTGIYKGFNNNGPLLNLNYINFILLGLGLLLHTNLNDYKTAVSDAIKGASGILIQFPLYAGIMGIMKYSGLTDIFTNYFVQISNANTFPVFTFISAGLVNMFVPSGGGQWAVQGPVLVEAAIKLSVSIPKTIMALAYGDQLTNMLQPFWALPLLGITGLKAKQIFPYTFFVMLLGGAIYITGLLLF